MSPAPQPFRALAQRPVVWVSLSSGAPGVRGQELPLDEPVQLVQVDVGQEGREDAALRRAAERRPVPPVLQIAGLKQPPDQPQEAVVVDLLAEYPQQDLVVDVVEA